MYEYDTSLGIRIIFADIWFYFWGIFWLIAFPVLLLVLPILRKISFLFV
ncbi:DUF2798 domain-containing protein [Acinetobacter courvalinii]